MFETAMERATQAARRRAAERKSAVTARLAEDLPRGIEVREDEAGVRLAGRGLARRFALDGRLRALVAGLVR